VFLFIVVHKPSGLI